MKHNGKTWQSTAEILRKPKYILEEFQTTNFKLACHKTSDTMQWIPPAQSWYKINTDRTTFVNTQSTGVGVIIRDYKRQVEAALSNNLPIPLGPIYGDWSKNIGEGVLFYWDARVRDVAFKSDSNIVVDALIRTSEALVAIDNIIEGIRVKLQDFRCVKFLMLSKMTIV